MTISHNTLGHGYHLPLDIGPGYLSPSPCICDLGTPLDMGPGYSLSIDI